MRKWIVCIILLFSTILPVSATAFTAPMAPESAQPYMPESQENFAKGLWHIIKSAVTVIEPALAEAAGTCLAVVVIVVLLSILKTLSNDSSLTMRLTGAVLVGILLLEPVSSMIRLSANTVGEISDYSKLILPVMTAALAAQGGTTTSAALYTGTALFDALISKFISRIIVPILYVYLAVCVANSALDQNLLKKIRDNVKWAMTWLMKWTLYIFTGYLSITGVVSGAVDSSVLKATKIGISGAVPVVGGILSDATETILVSAGLMKNTVGIYGMFAVLSICIGPFIKIGMQYLLLKLTATITDTLDYKPVASLVQDFSTGMGIALAMTGTVCVLLLVSLVCFMKGIGI